MIFEREIAAPANGLCLVFNVVGGVNVNEGRSESHWHIGHWLCCTMTTSLGAYLSMTSMFGRLEKLETRQSQCI